MAFATTTSAVDRVLSKDLRAGDVERIEGGGGEVALRLDCLFVCKRIEGARKAWDWDFVDTVGTPRGNGDGRSGGIGGRDRITTECLSRPYSPAQVFQSATFLERSRTS